MQYASVNDLGAAAQVEIYLSGTERVSKWKVEILKCFFSRSQRVGTRSKQSRGGSPLGSQAGTELFSTGMCPWQVEFGDSH